ncbi:MAG: crosslink repair DNA glycosylase YcaQ family protein [Clostridiaceae bacterium]|nr:crosslink repair DNA glycosylase YcaQ family protein [Clostridiaceae bacterium]
MELTKKQAARFLLMHHGLIGKRLYKGMEGVMQVFDRLGSVQYDPVNICGRNAELVFLARVDGYESTHLWDLLYRDRRLVDYFDKCMCIMPSCDLRYFRRTMEAYSIYGRSREQVEAVMPRVLQAAAATEYISSKDIGETEKIDWPWGRTSAARAAAERLYFEGRLAVHHKEGVVRYYSLPEKIGMDRHLCAHDPNMTEHQYYKWQVRRRIYSIGMMENRPGDGFLGVRGLKAAERRRAFEELEAEAAIIPVDIESKRYYIDSRDSFLAEKAKEDGLIVPQRCELIAPLDNIIWDRRLISDIFGFSYKWEIYTPMEQRKYSCYVLPVIYRDSFAGRIEPVADRKSGRLEVRNFWPEKGFRATESFKKALGKSLERLAGLNGCKEVYITCNI